MLRSAIDAEFVKPLKDAQVEINNARASLSRTLDVTTLFDNSETKKPKTSPIVNYAREENKQLNLELAKMKALREKMKKIGLEPLDTFELESEKSVKDDKRKSFFEKQAKDLLEQSNKSGFGAYMQGLFKKDKSAIDADEAEKKEN